MIADLEERLCRAGEDSRNLDEALGQLQAVTDEIETLKQQQPLIEQLQQEVQSQQEDIEAKSQEIENLSRETEKQQAKCSKLEEQTRENNKFAKENATLSKQLQKETLFKADLENKLKQETSKVAGLESAVAAAQKQAQQKDQLVEENANLNKQLKELDAQVSVVPSLQKSLQRRDGRISELESSIAASQRQAQEKEKLVEENFTIKKQLKELEARVTLMPALQKSVQQRDSRVGELEAALAASLRQVQEKDKLAEDNTNLQKEVAELQKENSALDDARTELQQKKAKVMELDSALVTAQEQAAMVDDLQRTNSSLKENVITLNSDLAQLTEERAQLGPLKDTIRAQEDEIAELQKQLVSLHGQAEELDKLKEELRRKEEELLDLQQQIIHLEGEVSNAKLDKEANETRLQRRAADQTPRTNMLAQHRDPHLALSHNDSFLSNGDTLHSSARTAIVPETQPQVAEALQDDLIPELDEQLDEQEDDSGSELTPLPSDEEDEDLEDGTQHGLARPRRSVHDQGHYPTTKDVDRSGGCHQRAERPPSSSYGSQSDQMLLDQVSQGDARGMNNVASTATNALFPWSRLASTQESSPRRLRSGSQGPARVPSTLLGPDSQPQRIRASTPSIRREPHLPNSAAKRRMEPENEDDVSQENPKKLKRRPANLDVRAPQIRTPKQASDQALSRRPTSWRKSSTVVGTNAPAPGKSQRSSKPARKGSKRDKFAARFAAES